jgi:hypothetical protein
MVEANLEVEEREQALGKSALADYKAGRVSPQTCELSAARNRLEGVSAAEAQAVEEIERLEKLSESLAREAELARAREIGIKRNHEVCIELQAGIEALVPLFSQYKSLAAQFRQLTRDRGQQIESDWRLTNLIDEKLLGRHLSRDLRITDLSEIEDRIFTGVLQRALKELKNGG